MTSSLLPLLAVTVLGVGLGRGRARRSPARRAAVLADLPRLDTGDLHRRPGESPAELVARLGPYARCQVPDDGWEDPRRPDGATGRVRPRTAAAAVRGPALALLLVLCAGSWWAGRWVLLETTATTTVPAVSTGDVSLAGPGPLPDDVTVEFRTPTGRTHRADVATAVPLPAGVDVRVEYAVGRPGEARLLGPQDALDRGAVLPAVGALAAGAWAGWRLRRLARHASGVRRARSGPRRPALGLLTSDSDGTPVLLLCDPLVDPARFLAVPVAAPLPAGTAAALAAEPQVRVHGTLGAGELVVVEPAAGGGALVPAGPALPLVPELVVVVLDVAGASTDRDDPTAG